MANKLLPKQGGWVLITANINTVYPIHKFGIYYAYPSGKYFYENEEHINSFGLIGYEKHPASMKDLSVPKDIFGGNDGFKIGIASYKRNPHHDFTERQKRWLESHYNEDDYGVQAQVKIVTEYGTICVNPHEYNLVDDEKLQEYMDNTKINHAFIVYLSNSNQLKGKIKEQVFYLRTRGIPYTDALQMCIGQVKTSNLFYIYLHPGYVEYFDRYFDSYVNKHLSAMKDYDVPLYDDFLNQVKEINGYQDFKHEYSPVKQMLSELL